MPPIRDRRLRYLLSLPERSLRAGVAVGAGAVKTAADHLLPGSLRSSHTYAAVVGRFERLLVEGLGGVEGVYEGDAPGAGSLLARKTAGNALELASFAVLHVSPLWFLAMAADASRGTRAFLEALTAELRREGVPVDERNARTVDGLLESLEHALGTGASAVDVPPLNVAALRETWRDFRASREPLPDAEALSGLFADLQATAAQTGGSLLAVGSLSGLGALAQRTAGGAARSTRRLGRAAAGLFGATVVEDYRRSLARMREEGFDTYTARLVRPYASAVRRHFDPWRETFTERRLLGR